MKAYIVRVEFDDSNPLIWRKVIMPADVTFKRLNEVIQAVTNFNQNDITFEGHLYEFQLNEENRIVTNNDEAYEEHQYYKQNKSFFENRLKTTDPDMMESEQRYQDRLKREVRKPSGIKIDAYLEKFGSIDYLYDYGDSWRITVTLEETVEDYYFGYPTLLDGSETAPPEDVGGMTGFYQFLEAYHNPSHPDHQELQAWATSQRFKEYDPKQINRMLKKLLTRKLSGIR
ncbi:plasmid pRiA4b ORF-3 family protein [Marinilactibacillus sp. XAAS-LB27]|uniref:plasmid pRiA4b ORF-3 family protein n=1 Tax=Marinilactibacillus sp. XAAS-LB27 TaxID=3114538 RepID=UPI002E19575E|nr:plasmid pRiA4b ORF-3 family protein [Marinilactibacillus sp. XAAS-LB27]